MNEIILTVKQALERNNIEVHLVDGKDDVVGKVAELLHDGDSVAVGGSNTLWTTGVIDHLRSGRYRFYDRHEQGLTPRQIRRVFLQSFTVDAYLCSANAVTLNGEIYNVDGNSNRIAAICYGPDSVIMVVGKNKIVKDLEEAKTRVEQIAAPANCVRLNKDNPCVKMGECMHCNHESTICNQYVVTRRSGEKGRIHIILVNEELGY